MKNKEQKLSNTLHVFSNSNNVYLINDQTTPFNLSYKEVWSPLNFQWIPVLKLQEELNNM